MCESFDSIGRPTPDLKNLSELLKGKTVAHRSGPFCHRRRHSAQVGDLPFHAVAHNQA